MIKISFHSVVEADKASKILKWDRHHHYGSLTFEITLEELRLLKNNGIGFWYE